MLQDYFCTVFYDVEADATSVDHETTVDGVHPDNHGYSPWAKSVERQIVKILARYGTK